MFQICKLNLRITYSMIMFPFGDIQNVCLQNSPIQHCTLKFINALVYCSIYPCHVQSLLRIGYMLTNIHIFEIHTIKKRLINICLLNTYYNHLNLNSFYITIEITVSNNITFYRIKRCNGKEY